jgi:phosphoadenosine phosphosulfate reductase
MGLQTLFGNKVDIAIGRIRQFEPPDGYYLAFSGGKDSQAIYHLTVQSGVKYDAHMNLTTVDPPEVIRFVRKNYPEVSMHKPEKTMWQLIEEKGMPPTRIVKYCCEWLKERGGADRLVMTGVRWEESAIRRNRAMVEQCRAHKGKRFLHPIIDWTTEDIWEYHREHRLPYLSLYDQMSRVGCICCPNGGPAKMRRDAERWPTYRAAYIRAIQKGIDKRIANGLPTTFRTGEEMFDWWVAGGCGKQESDENQIRFFFE